MGRYIYKMTLMGRAVCGVSVATIMVLLTGCSLDTLIWGTDGAQVIKVTDKLVSDFASDGTSDLVCGDFDAEIGTPRDWSGLSAGEPEEFFGEHWIEQVELDPQWSINLEGMPEGAAPGSRYPGDVFYRETDDGLCAIDVSWATLISAS